MSGINSTFINTPMMGTMVVFPLGLINQHQVNLHLAAQIADPTTLLLGYQFRNVAFTSSDDSGYIANGTYLVEADSRDMTLPLFSWEPVMLSLRNCKLPPALVQICFLHAVFPASPSTRMIARPAHTSTLMQVIATTSASSITAGVQARAQSN